MHIVEGMPSEGRGPERPEIEARSDEGRSDEEQFEEMSRLDDDGWRSGGYNFHGDDQRYHVVMTKGNDSKEFVLAKPHPTRFGAPEGYVMEHADKKTPKAPENG